MRKLSTALSMKLWSYYGLMITVLEHLDELKTIAKKIVNAFNLAE